MKLQPPEGRHRRVRVAPLVGAWIEMWGYIIEKMQDKVAPLVGAWIEIFFDKADFSGR